MPEVVQYATAQLKGIIFQCWSRLTVNICFVISRNKCNKFVSPSMTQQHRIRIDLPNNAVRPKNRHKCMVSHGLYHVPREHGSRDAMFPGNMMLQWRNRATLFIFEHHVTCVGPDSLGRTTQPGLTLKASSASTMVSRPALDRGIWRHIFTVYNSLCIWCSWMFFIVNNFITVQPTTFNILNLAKWTSRWHAIFKDC